MLPSGTILTIVIMALTAILLLVIETLSGFDVAARNKSLALPTALPE